MVLVVIPAYNEEAEVGRVIRGLFEQGFKDVVVVDDGSTDKTANEARTAGAKVLSHVLNRGQGASLETGNAYARKIGADVVVHFDADGQFNPGDIAPGLKLMDEKKLDVILGSRFLDDRSQLPLLKKYFVLPTARLINHFFTGIKLTDVHNGFRILSERALEIIRLTQDRMAHNTEIVQQIKKNHLSFAEFPVEVRYREYGQGALHGFKIIHDLVLSLFF